jgi:hypothetical protein
MHLGLQDRTGTLEGGKRADLILISTTGWNMAPLNDPANQIVQAAHPGNVHSVLVDGRIVKWDGRITVIDEGTQHKLRERGGACHRRAPSLVTAPWATTAQITQQRVRHRPGERLTGTDATAVRKGLIRTGGGSYLMTR